MDCVGGLINLKYQMIKINQHEDKCTGNSDSSENVKSRAYWLSK